MEWNWHLVFNLAWLVAILGFVIWLFIRAFKSSVAPGLLIFKWGVTLPIIWFLWRQIGPMIPQGGGNTIGGLLIATGCLFVIAIVWRGSLIDAVVSPFTAIFDGGSEPMENKPYYSIATTRRKRGEYREAVMAVRGQLEKFPNDFEGVMLLAAIQAENLKDLQAAELALNHFCALPQAPEKQVAAAWTTLADWYLKINLDVDAARASLQKIIDRYPETELALRAEQRIAHLGSTEKILLEQHDRPVMAVPEGVKNLGLQDSMALPKPEIEPGRLAAAYVKHLETHPHDSEVREKLALLYARDFQRLDLATMELAQLINEPRHSPKQIAQWLNLLANLQIDLGADVATVTATLEQIVQRYPDLPVAEIARRRLARVNLEFKGKGEASPGVKLGTYEQNIGLKYGGPRRQQ